MPVIIIDGPEKAGKSTTVEALRKALLKDYPDITVLKWGPVTPDDRVYAQALEVYTTLNESLAIFDRGWPSEYVYGKLLNRKTHRMWNDPWIGAWLHDRAVQANGLRVMMLGQNVRTLKSLRNKSDLDVDPEDEIKLYEEYADRFGWLSLVGYNYTEAALNKNVRYIISNFKKELKTKNTNSYKPLPPSWAGPQNADVVFVGQIRSENPLKGGWLPFASRMTTEFGRVFGDKAIEYAWTNAHDCPPSYISDRKVIVACGNTAQTWVRHYVMPKGTVINVPHPSYLYRYKTEKTARALRHAIADLNQILKFQGDNT